VFNAHLKSDKFDTANFEIAFKSTKFAKTGDKTGKVTASLIKGVTSRALDVTLNRLQHPINKKQTLGIGAARFSRRLRPVLYAPMTPDDVSIEIKPR
jgi:polyisoprenoid-binding protein YceI